MKKNLLVILLIFIVKASFAQWVLSSAPSLFYGAVNFADFNGNMLVSTNEGIYATSDGTTWTDLTNGAFYEDGISWRQVFAAGTDIYAGSTYQAVIKSSDNGSTWSFDTTGLETGGPGGLQITALHYDINSNHLLASKGFAGYGLFYKKPSDTSWTRVNSNNVGSSTAYVYGLESIGAGIGSAVCAATSGGFFISIDGGMNWTQKAGANLPLNELIESFTGDLLTTDGFNIYCATRIGVYKSTDMGDLWTRIDQGFAGYNGSDPKITAIKYINGVLYAGVEVTSGNDSAYYSVDAGMTWNDMSGGLESQIIAFHEFGGSIYAASKYQDSVLVWGGSLPNAISEKESKSETLQIFPVPAIDYVTIQSNDWGKKERVIKVFDTDGRMIKYYKGIVNDHFMIPVQDLDSGIYLVEVLGSRTRMVSKFIKN